MQVLSKWITTVMFGLITMRITMDRSIQSKIGEIFLKALNGHAAKAMGLLLGALGRIISQTTENQEESE